MSDEPINYDDPSASKRPWITIMVEGELHEDVAGMGLSFDGKLVEGLPEKFTAADVLALMKRDGHDDKSAAISEWDLLGDPRITVQVQWPGKRTGMWERTHAEW